MQLPVLFGRRFTQLLLGLGAFGVGIGLMVRGAVGVPPWDVLAQGLSNLTGIPFGYVTLLVGVAIMLLWIPLREKPGLGTVLNVLMLGPLAQIVIDVIPEQTSLLTRIPLFSSGLLLLALGTGLYIGAQFGPGPRDGLMTGLHRVTGWPVWIVRTAIELTALIIGWIFGGDVWVGTLVFALFVGPLSQPAMRWFDLRQRILDELERQLPDSREPDSSSTIETC